MSITTACGSLKQILPSAVGYIVHCQRADGAIPWFPQGKLDPWDHTEAAMGLAIGREFDAAKRAFRWLWENQNPNGSWQAQYLGGADDAKNLDQYKVETNFVAYPACGLWHYFLITQDRDFIAESFSHIERAIDFVIAQQTPEGDIQWASSSAETLPKDALVTACASILRSLECALHLATTLKQKKTHWQQAYQQLADALKNKPWRFDRTWAAKTRFSMDWFYPILSGIYTTEEARARLDSRWDDFVHPDFGCRCVSDEPWVTVAESCELTLALVASQQPNKAQKIFKQLLRWQDNDGGFWTGYSFRDQCIWPLEKTTWTAAAILLAADALDSITPAAHLLTRPSQFFKF